MPPLLSAWYGPYGSGEHERYDVSLSCARKDSPRPLDAPQSASRTTHAKIHSVGRLQPLDFEYADVAISSA